MKSSLQECPPYLGVDLTDRYANHVRPIDVCGVEVRTQGVLVATFWTWEWDPSGCPLNIDEIKKEVDCRIVMIDGPQALATPPNRTRVCERQCGAPGHTPHVRPARGVPFSGFINSSLDLFDALYKAGISISAPKYRKSVHEVYPGNVWQLLTPQVLPPKGTLAGRRARKEMLMAYGVVGLPECPTHDQNDACIAAVLAAAADGKVRNMQVGRIGEELVVDANGILREGPMVIPVSYRQRGTTGAGPLAPLCLGADRVTHVAPCDK